MDIQDLFPLTDEDSWDPHGDHGDLDLDQPWRARLPQGDVEINEVTVMSDCIRLWIHGTSDTVEKLRDALWNIFHDPVDPSVGFRQVRVLHDQKFYDVTGVSLDLDTMSPVFEVEA